MAIKHLPETSKKTVSIGKAYVLEYTFDKNQDIREINRKITNVLRKADSAPLFLGNHILLGRQVRFHAHPAKTIVSIKLRDLDTKTKYMLIDPSLDRTLRSRISRLIDARCKSGQKAEQEAVYVEIFERGITFLSQSEIAGKEVGALDFDEFTREVMKIGIKELESNPSA